MSGTCVAVQSTLKKKHLGLALIEGTPLYIGLLGEEVTVCRA